MKETKVAISFGSCMAGSAIQAIREEFDLDVRFASRVLHNRIDQFLDCFVRNTHRPLEWQDITHILKNDAGNELLADLRLYLNNQTAKTIGRHAIDIDTSFFEAISSFKEPLIVIDNYMDIASKLLERKASKQKGFLNWGALQTDKMIESFSIVDYITPSHYISELNEFLSYIRLLSPRASIALILFPSEVALSNDRPSVINSREINEVLAQKIADISEHYNIFLHKSRPVAERDLVNQSDWSHYSKDYYREIANQVMQGLTAIKRTEQSKPTLIEMLPRQDNEAAVQESLLQMQFSVSVVIQFFQDIDHIEEVIKSIAWADEIIINDGPFAFAMPVFEYVLEENEQYRRESENFFQALAARTGSNIVYNYGTFEDEREKRIYGYSKAEADVILSIDADEILDIDKDSLRAFVDSSALVGMFECVNLTFHNMCIAKPMPLANGPYPNKPFAFKGRLVESERHLDYLWLIGTRQANTSTSDYFLQPICKGLHFTNVRSAKGAAVKFGFYTALAWKEDQEGPRNGPFADCSYYFSPPNGFADELKWEILSNALPASLGFPEGFSLALYTENQSPFLAQIAEAKNITFKPKIISGCAMKSLLPGIPNYFYIDNFEKLTIYCNHSMPAQIVLHYYIVGMPATQSRVSGLPHSFSTTNSSPYIISIDQLELGIDPQWLKNKKESITFCLLQVCCWGGDDLKSRIKETGMPVQMSVRMDAKAA